MYHETNDVQRSARMIWLPMDPADNILMAPGTGSARDAAYVALMLTGCIESEYIGYVEITVNLEYVPRLEYWNTVVRELVPSDSTV
jgi:phosphoheptose isomerase